MTWPEILLLPLKTRVRRKKITANNVSTVYKEETEKVSRRRDEARVDTCLHSYSKKKVSCLEKKRHKNQKKKTDGEQGLSNGRAIRSGTAGIVSPTVCTQRPKRRPASRQRPAVKTLAIFKKVHSLMDSIELERFSLFPRGTNPRTCTSTNQEKGKVKKRVRKRVFRY